jgi:hypothetical protein
MIITRIGMITPVGHDAQRSLHAGAQKTNSIGRRGPQILRLKTGDEREDQNHQYYPAFESQPGGGS